ncbi:hypothetical protein JTE90_018614 [Oedothorax gibbosus]|uniref:Mitochondrial import inner membrane translocase subunit n=1 Tax=Oedothorax gibbosus TaxID=931172 RepID=A0AAV6ULV9_9ARAC|nr:hypothetical protein JTE90_018614 [Oedothorax gibbosus]
MCMIFDIKLFEQIYHETKPSDASIGRSGIRYEQQQQQLNLEQSIKHRPKRKLMMETSDNQSNDSELEKFLTVEKVKTQFHEQVHFITDICWDKCIDKPGSKLDGKNQACLVNCVERFIDSSLILTQRFAHMLQKQGNF